MNLQEDATETVQYSIVIGADPKTVWEIMLADRTYRLWTAAFFPGSFYEGSWAAGSEIRFLARNAEGVLEGMFSRIKERIEHRFISIEHLGMIRDGVVDTASPEVQAWAHALENYTFTGKDGTTNLTVDLQLDPQYRATMDTMWPKALQLLKELCELTPRP